MADSLSSRRVAALAAVRLASGVCRAVQERRISPETITKKDRSPVTVADFASQALICHTLLEAFPDDPVVGEEDAGELRQPEEQATLTAVLEHVQDACDACADEETALSWIDLGGAPAEGDRYWTLDPIDGTKGFLRKEQYAVALALIEHGQVVLGVLGCPNLPGPEGNGLLMVAQRGQGAELLPLWSEATTGSVVKVSANTNLSAARFCESVESGHSDQDQSVQIAKLLGINSEAVRMDSQAKYATVARGEAEIYLRLPTRADYREKIWDHAAGMLAVTEAGGTVTDVTGAPLDFSRGRKLERNQGIIATNGPIHQDVVKAVRQVLGV